MPAREYTPEGMAVLLYQHAEAIPAMLEGTVSDTVRDVVSETRRRAPGDGPLKSAARGNVTSLSQFEVTGTAGVGREAGDAGLVLVGTGVYGPLHRAIRTLKHGMPISVGGRTLFRKSQKGTPKNPFFDEAVAQAMSRLPDRGRRLGERAADLERR